MLKSLNIKDFALVEKLDLDFEKGMISLTGETGAGKSILLGAIGIIIGEKPKKNAVRNGADKGIVSAVFDISYLPSVQSFLRERDLLDDEDEQECIIRRVLRKDGRSSTFVNENTTNLKTLKELGEMLVEIHGQHQHQNLAKGKKQFDVLDSFGGLKELRKEVSSLYKAWRDKEKNALKVKEDFEENHNRFQLLNYKKTELEELDVRENEFEELEEEHRHLSSADSVINDCETAMQYVKHGFDSEGTTIGSLINSVISHIHNLEESEATKEIIEMLETAQINIEEVAPLIRDYQDKFEVNPERLMEVDDRLRRLNKASENFHCFPEQLHTLLDEINNEIDELNYSEDAVEKAREETEIAFVEYLERAKILSVKRQEKASQLSKEVNEETIKLNLAEDILRVDFIKSSKTKKSELEYSSYGIDNINFLIRPNLGQDYQPISEIASGGELSRLSLAVQVVSFKNEKKPTMIFDEVDTGLSGETGNVVGEMLRRVGGFGQVMCVTHLPQVAAQGHYHFFVSKNNVERDGEIITLSNIKELNREERVKEVARMIGGSINSKESISNAELMLSLHN